MSQDFYTGRKLKRNPTLILLTLEKGGNVVDM